MPDFAISKMKGSVENLANQSYKVAMEPRALAASSGLAAWSQLVEWTLL